MSNVLIDREKIDILANAISDKSGVPVTMTLEEMVEAVDGIENNPAPILQSKTYTVDSAGTETITADSGYDGLSEVEVTVPSATLAIWTDQDFYNDSGTRKWRYRGQATADPEEAGVEGWMGSAVQSGDWYVRNAVSSGTTITPTESAQTVGGTNYMMEGAVTVNAISSTYVGSGITRRDSTDLSASGATVTVPSGYYSAQASKAVASGTAGTPTATKGMVSNHSVSITPSVTNQTGYITGSTKTGTAVTVTASELVSGTYTVDSSGTKDVTNYASISVPSGSIDAATNLAGVFNGNAWTAFWSGYVSKSGYVTQSTSVSKSQTFNAVPANTTITPTTSSQTIGGSNYMMEGAVTVSGDQNLSASNIKKNVSIFGVTGTYEGGGGSSMQIGNMEGLATSSSISFTGLQGEPTAFSFMIDASVATGTPSKIVAVVFDGTSLHAQTITNTANAQVTYNSTSLSKTYSNGTLTITSNGPSFVADIYYGVYVYDGGAVETKDVQVGSGATSITFTGLEAEPAWWSCIFKSNFSSSSGYQRVIYVAKGDTTTNVSGLEMDSGAHNAVHWTASYNNGSFTITSQGTNQGGYFHQPGYYQLTYAYDGSGGASSITTEPLSVTTNSTYTAPNGKAYTPVYVNVSGASIGTKTLTNSTATATSLQFTSMLGQPKAFFLRLTAQIARSSSYRYYYVENVRYNGTNTNGRYFYQYNGTLYNDTTHYSYSYSGTTLTISSTGSQSDAGGSFYNDTYELVYIY